MEPRTLEGRPLEYSPSSAFVPVMFSSFIKQHEGRQGTFNQLPEGSKEKREVCGSQDENSERTKYAKISNMIYNGETGESLSAKFVQINQLQKQTNGDILLKVFATPLPTPRILNSYNTLETSSRA